MRGAVPLLPHYAFMAWIRQLSLIRDSTVEAMFLAMMQDWSKPAVVLG